MKLFIIKVISFCLIGILLGEIIVRLFSLTTDVPKMYQDEDGLIKYYPNQSGNYVNGSHEWIINKYGHFGYEPQSLDKIITVVGDSFISNIMNPPECHQANYLAALNPRYNFFPASRDGASFLESMIRIQSLDSINPMLNLLYVSSSDFAQSIVELNKNQDMVQVSVKNDEIYFPALSQNAVKEFLYNFKFAYFLYRNYIVEKLQRGGEDNEPAEQKDKEATINYAAIQNFLSFIQKRFDISNVVLVFHPKSDTVLMEIAEKAGFETIELTASNYKSWQLPNDSHWSCFGHKQVALQVTQYLQSEKFRISRDRQINVQKNLQ